MLKKLKNIANTEDKKRLLSNFFSLSVLQGANYILPLLTLPYLVRVLGVEYFGLLAFVSAMIAYFSIITDYGFNLTATREISIHRENKRKVIEIFSSVMSIKVILMFFSFILLCILIFSFDKFSQDWEIYLLTFGTVIGQVLFPVWFFQGMERMKYITYLNILSKLIFTVAIFVFVQEQSDFWIVPLLTSVGFIIAGILSLVLIRKEFGVWFEWQSVGTLKYYIMKAKTIFMGQFSYSLVHPTIIILLGMFSSNTIVGHFSIADKIIQAIAKISNPISQTIFPYLTSKYLKNQHSAFSFLKRITILYTIFISFIMLFVFYFSENILIFIYGNNISIVTINIFNILCLYPVLYSIVHIFCTQILLITSNNVFYTKILFISFIATILLGTFLISIFSVYGAVYTMIITELIIFVAVIIFTNSNIRKII